MEPSCGTASTSSSRSYGRGCARRPDGCQSFHTQYSPEATALLEREGPKYQYGHGCLSDGVLGAWIAACCGVEEILDPDKVASHVQAVYRHNFRRDLSGHANPQRPTYALGHEAGLLLCTWPKGGELTLPFVYSNEVWTGIEYQVASHLMMAGHVAKGLEIVRAVRDRYDGRVRNPFNEYECGHWYARAMASYGLLQGLTGPRYDAVEKTLYLRPSVPGDFRAFLCTATGYGTVGVRDGQPFVEVKQARSRTSGLSMSHAFRHNAQSSVRISDSSSRMTRMARIEVGIRLSVCSASSVSDGWVTTGARSETGPSRVPSSGQYIIRSRYTSSTYR